MPQLDMLIIMTTAVKTTVIFWILYLIIVSNILIKLNIADNLRFFLKVNLLNNRIKINYFYINNLENNKIFINNFINNNNNLLNKLLLLLPLVTHIFIHKFIVSK